MTVAGTVLMTARERMRIALAGGQPPDHVPLWEIEFHQFDHYAEEPLVVGDEFAALGGREQEHALRRNAESMVAVAIRLGHSALTCPGGYWGTPGAGAVLWLPGDGPWRQLAALRQAAGEELAVVMFVAGTIMPPVDGEAYAAFCYRLHDAPGEIDRQAADTLKAGIEQVRRARDLGADAVCNAADIADSHGVFFSPPMFERFWLPYLREWCVAVRRVGLYGILHSDGNLTGVLDRLADSGLHALQAIDPIAGMDIAAVKARVGERLCLCGNIDCGLLQFGPTGKIAAETARVCEAAKPGGRFVFGATNAVFAGIPPLHYETMLAAWREHGRYAPNLPGPVLVYG